MRSAGERGRALPRPRDGSAEDGRERGMARRTVHASGSPPRRIASNSGNSDRPAREPGRRSAGTPRAARAGEGRAPARRVSPLHRRSPRSSAHPASCQAQEGAELRYLGRGRRRTSGQHQIDRRQSTDLVTHRLAEPAFDPVAHHGISHLGRHGDANARSEPRQSRSWLARPHPARSPGRGERTVEIALAAADREEFAAAAQPTGPGKREGFGRVHDPISSRRSPRAAGGLWRGAV